MALGLEAWGSTRERRDRRLRTPRCAAACAALLSLLLPSACAAPDAEIHLAPFFSRHTLPGYDHTEAAGGILHYGQQGDRITWALRPLVWHRQLPDGDVRAHFLYPLGKFELDADRPRTMARLFPIFWREAETRPDGVEDIDWAFLPPFFWGGSSSDDQENYFAFFPFFGTLKDFLTYDEANFILWPLYLDNRKDARRSYHLLWPFFGWTEGSEVGWHVFPLYGEAEVPGKYKRAYYFWPLVHTAEEELDKPHPRQGWLVVPLAGHITQDDYTATTVLWPIYGEAERPSTGYSSWSVWPILKFESGGRDENRKLARVLPFYLHFEDDHVEYTSYLWPIFWDRSTSYGDVQEESFYAVPFYWATRRKDSEGNEDSDWRVWPLVKSESSTNGTEWSAALAPGIEPLLDSKALSDNLGFLFEIWSTRRDEPNGPREQRGPLNLYHQAEVDGHSRWSIPVLGGVWTEPDGTEHYSFLLGLLRFRSGEDGGFEEPAFPGPGWPDLHAAKAAWLQPTEVQP